MAAGPHSNFVTTNSDPTTGVRRVAHAELSGWVRRVLAAHDVPERWATVAAVSLVAANLRGVDSHGLHLLPYYVKHLRIGNINPATEGVVVSESGACLVYDGQHALGQVVSTICCDHALRLAGVHGVGMVVSRNSSHFGTAAYWGQRISDGGMIGVVMCNASPSVPPWQGREGRIGTNPLCVSMPTRGGGHWLLDMATTKVAINKILRARSDNLEEIPEGWATDADGVPTTTTAKAHYAMPLGGYKGSGLGLMTEVLGAVLSGGVLCTEVGGVPFFDRPMNTSQTFIAIDPSRFLPAGELQARMEDLVSRVKSSPPASGYHEVLVAGEPEVRIEEDRRTNGIPVQPGVWRELEEIAIELSLPLPELR